MSPSETSPARWLTVPFKAAIRVEKGHKPRELGPRSSERTVPYVNIRAFERGIVEDYCNPTERIVRCSKGDVLIVWDGARSGMVGRAIEGAVGSTLARLTSEVLEPGFILRFLEGKYRELNSRTKGMATPHLDSSLLAGIEMPVPPRAEQLHIVEALESRLTRLEEAVSDLERAQTNIQRYRRSVLRTALVGDLVPQEVALIESTGTHCETAEDLVRRLGGVPLSTESVTLPDGWCACALGSLFEIQVGATPSRRVNSYWGGDIPWVSSGEVTWSRIRATRESITSEALGHSSAKRLPKGTVLLAMIGQGRTRGQAAILDIEACSNQNSAAIRVSDQGLPPEFVFYFLQDRYQRTRAEGSGNQQQALNKSAVQSIVIPVPPLREQQRIVAEIERLFSVADTAMEEVERSLALCNMLRVSIMGQAFNGKLVLQDPNVEPANPGFERIEREARSGVRDTATRPEVY